MISKNEILQLHKLSIEKYGGAHGIRDEGMLESAIARPFQTFGGEDLYGTPIEKAAAILESLIINHPFVDGNKRTGFLAMFAILKKSNLSLIAKEADAYAKTVSVSTGEIRFEQIVEWLKANVENI